MSSPIEIENEEKNNSLQKYFNMINAQRAADAGVNEIIDANEEEKVTEWLTNDVSPTSQVCDNNIGNIHNLSILQSPFSENRSFNSCLSIYYQNVRGLQTKSKEFYLSSCSSNYDIVALTETWINNSHKSEEFFNQDYVVYRRDRDYDNLNVDRGGGVLIAVNSNIQSEMMPLNCCVSDEILCVKFKIENFNYLVFAVYIRPGQPVEVYSRYIDLILTLRHRLGSIATVNSIEY